MFQGQFNIRRIWQNLRLAFWETGLHRMIDARFAGGKGVEKRSQVCQELNDSELDRLASHSSDFSTI